MKELIRINGMSCMHCVKSIEKALSVLPSLSAQVEIGSVKVEYDDSVLSHETILKAIDDAGYESEENTSQE
jgi:copper chaperone CopZ